MVDPLLRDVPLKDGHKFLYPVRILRRLGEGGMGVVYLGQNVELENEVAVKVLKPWIVRAGDGVDSRFRREAKLAAELNHPNLVRVLSRKTAYGLTYLVLEYVDGVDAEQYLAQRGGALPARDAAWIVYQAAKGLSAAHAHRYVIVHRDVKPLNIFVSADGRAKVGDLGLATALDPSHSFSHKTSGIVGTLRYLAPEQWTPDSGLTGPRTDVWGLGATLFFLLSGGHYARGETHSQVYADLCERPWRDPCTDLAHAPGALIDIATRCLQRDPAARYADAGELARALRSYLNPRAVAAPSDAARPATSRRTFIGLGAMALAAASYFALRGDAGRAPEGWEAVDPTPGDGGWAKRVREPRSGVVLRLVEAGMLERTTKSTLGSAVPLTSAQPVASYYLAEHETTGPEYYRVMAKRTSSPDSTSLPASGVLFEAAAEFCSLVGGALPTALQWEYAARAGRVGDYVWGSDPAAGGREANLYDVSGHRALMMPGRSEEHFAFDDTYPGLAPVASLRPNPWGFFDLVGNVMEWCRDGKLYGGAYDMGPRDTPLHVGVRLRDDVKFGQDRTGFRLAYDLP
ncbi:MAG: bifunctional serine/threonine-protein kinase/formylglycine-generating enzyme family protein [Planctomycetota bacterium]